MLLSTYIDSFTESSVGACDFVMLRRTEVACNFFMFGRRRGPSNHLFLQGGVGYTNDCAVPSKPNGFKPVARHLVRHECAHCKYIWRFDRAAVRCPVEPKHNKVEIGLHHDWSWGKSQPMHFYEQLGQGYWPQVGVRLSDDSAGSKHNRERRSAMCSTEDRKRAKWAIGLSRKGANPFGDYKPIHWRARFPYAS